MDSLKQPVTAIKGIGEESAKLLEELNIFTVEDLLFYFPYRYDDFRLKNLEEAEHDEKVTVEGIIQSVPSLTFYGRKKSRLTCRVLVGNHLITAVFLTSII